MAQPENSGAGACLVLTLTKKNNGPWPVKDIDTRSDAEQICSRFEPHLAGLYDAPPKK
ncbi:MAG TPA: hypothetical protein VGE74_03245 [Gemmata sp.]